MSWLVFYFDYTWVIFCTYTSQAEIWLKDSVATFSTTQQPCSPDGFTLFQGTVKVAWAQGILVQQRWAESGSGKEMDANCLLTFAVIVTHAWERISETLGIIGCRRQ